LKRPIIGVEVCHVKEKRRNYGPEFKREAVQMAAMPGCTVRQVARDLGVGEGLLGRWKRELAAHGEQAFIGQGQVRDEEMIRLKREVAVLRKERDFLREAATFFAKASK